MPFVFSAILSWFSGLAGKFLTDSLLKWAAVKVLVFTTLTITFPIVVKNLINWLFTTVSAVASSNISTDGLHSTVLNLSGLSGYLASVLMIPDCIAIIMTAIVIRFTLNLVPFVG